jgi:hypothetical protein
MALLSMARILMMVVAFQSPQQGMLMVTSPAEEAEMPLIVSPFSPLITKPSELDFISDKSTAVPLILPNTT